MPLEIGRLRPGDVDLARQLAHAAFAPASRALDPARPWHAAARVHAAYQDGRLVACACVHETAHWFAGGRVPMGGVGSVAVAPDVRRRGLARQVVRDALHAMRERGECICSLYPTTSALYRSLGWDVAGTYRITRFPLGALRDLPRAARADVLRPCAYDPARFAPLATALARDHGGRERSPLNWAQRAHDLAAGHTYALEREGQLAGFVSYRHGPPRAAPAEFGLDVRDLCGIDGAACLALLQLLASHDTLADCVVTTLPVEWLAMLIPQHTFEPLEERLWMLRIVDARAACAARGYLPGVSVRVELALRDAELPDNAGAWVLEVRDGRGALARGGSGRVELDVGALASLYTGWASPWDLARSGALAGAKPEDLSALAAAFAGPRPQFVDYF